MINHSDIVLPLHYSLRERSYSIIALPLRTWAREQLVLPSTSAQGVKV